MKRALSLLLSILLVLSMVPVQVFATEEDPNSGTCGENLTWVYDESNETLTISGTGEMAEASWSGVGTVSNVVIEAGVTSISAQAFMSNSALTSVTLADSIEHIGMMAFALCENLQYIELPGNLTNIGVGAFRACALQSVEIPAKVASIGDGAFVYCNDLTQLQVAEENPNFTAVDNVLFTKDMSTLLFYPTSKQDAAYTVPDGVKTLKRQSMAGNSYLTKIVLPEGLTTIDVYAFNMCTSLETVEMPSTLTTIAECAFPDCHSLNNVVIPASVTLIENGAFYNCTSLDNITFQGDAPESYDNADLPIHTFTGVTATAYYPADNDTWTEEAKQRFLGGEITWVAAGAAEEDPNSGTCGENLTWVYDKASTTLSISGTGAMTSYDQDEPWRAFAGQITNIVIKDGVTGLSNGAFSGHTALTKAVLPEGLTYLGYNMFSGCTSLKEVSLPSTLLQIGQSAFYQCKALTEIVLPDKVARLDNGAFVGSGLKSITLNNVQSMDIQVFMGCQSLASVQLSNKLPSIPAFTFSYCGALTEISIPASVTAIGNNAFNNCGGLKTVTFNGDAPTFEDDTVFKSVTATAYYPAGNATWTSDVMQNYGGSITWVAACVNGHTEETVKGKAATCTEDGKTDGKKCSVCGTVTVKQETIAAKGHTEETVKGKAATCTEDGKTDGKKCSVCGTVTVKQETIAANGHTEETVKGKAATCTEAGKTDGKKCSVCDTVIQEQEEIPAKGHTYENGKCKNCGAAEAKKIAAPKITGSTVSASGKPKVSWKAVDGAAKYQVYRSTKKTSGFKRVTTTTKLSYTDTQAEAGTLYYYKVKSVDEDGKTSGYSNRISRLCDLARPDVTVTNVASSGKIKLSWPAVKGAVKYQIYRSKTGKDGSFGRIATTTKTTYTNTKTTAGVKYYYKVKAIHTNTDANSVFSEVESRVCDLERTTISIKRNSAGKPRISWDSVDGAVKYEVWRATSKNGKYTRISTTKNLSLVNKKAVAGKTYYYKVRALHSNSNANSAYSLPKYIKAK